MSRQRIVPIDSAEHSYGGVPSPPGAVPTNTRGEPMGRPGAATDRPDPTFLRNEALDPTDPASIEMTVDGSVSAVTFSVGPGPNEVLLLDSILITLIDAGMQWDEFGNIGALTNGILIDRYEGGEAVKNLTDNIPIYSNGCLIANTDANIIGNGALGSRDIIQVPILGSGTVGGPIKLLSSNSGKVVVQIRDDVSGVDMFRMKCRCWFETEKV